MSHTRALPASLVVAALLSATTGAAVPQGAPTQVPLIITRETVILAAERMEVEHTYPPPPSRLGESVDLQILRAAEQSQNADVRAAFVRALGRFEQPWDVERISLHVNDSDQGVREATVRALVQALVNAKAPDYAWAIQMAFDVLRGQLAFDPALVPTILRSIGELPLDGAQVTEAVRLLSVYINPTPPFAAAIDGLASLARHVPDLPISVTTRAALRDLAVYRIARDPPDPILAAVQALSALHDDDERTIVAVAGYHCPAIRGGTPDCGWEFRYLGVQMMNGGNPGFSRTLHERTTDPSYQVRMAALRVEALAIPRTKSCGPLIDALSDAVPQVVLQAIDLMNPDCIERDDVAARLLSWAIELADAQNNTRWHFPAHALEALARFRPADAKRIANDRAASHDVWQVRAAAAHVAGVLKDEPLALRLMKDSAPNVRTEALQALARMRSGTLVSAAVDSLDSKDYQLVLYAAMLLKKVALGRAGADEFARVGTKPLMTALARLTADDKESSRDPRIELLSRIGEYGDPSDSSFVDAVREYLKDVDPVVASAAADALDALTGLYPDPEPTRRAIAQPTEAELQALRGRTGLTQVWLTDGSHIDFKLDMEEAPIAAARFVTLADEGYYKGLTFHRVVPDLIQGGSPGANGFAVAARFWRDEIGGPHIAGAVGLATRGRHTGDAQFFIDLMDAPQFNREYTVLGYGCVPDRVLEGAVIVNLIAFAATRAPTVVGGFGAPPCR